MKYTLRKEGTDSQISSNQLSFIEWNEYNKAKSIHNNIKLGRSCLLGSRSAFFTWMTTEIMEIIENTPFFKHFKTKNSEYKLYIEMEKESRINELINYLQGTCESLDHALDLFGIDYNDLTKEDFDQIDGDIFCCETCGWWCEISEVTDLNGENICTDCYDSLRSDEDYEDKIED